MKAVYSIDNHLTAGDPLEPCFSDVITQIGQLDVGEKLPEGWRVLDGNNIYSLVARVVMRDDITD